MKKTTDKTTTHGGARPGAGRKKQLGFGEETKPLRVPVSLIPMVKEMLEVRKETLAQLSQAILKPSDELPAFERPIFSSNVSAGFPSPADDYIEGQLDLNELMVPRPSTTFYVRVTGESMKDAGILPDDILVVDRSKPVQNKAIVIAIVDNELTVKRFQRRGNLIQLIPENPDYPVITLTSTTELSIWGVVTGVVRKL